MTRSSRLNRKYPVSHSRKSSTSTEAKCLRYPMLEKINSPNKGSPKAIKSHEDSENSNSKSKSSSKMSFWDSPDLSPGIEKLVNAMNLCDDSKSLIISINLCNIKNMIHLSNLELDELSVETYGIQVSKTQSSRSYA
jgi:hypothetical protein